MSKVISLFVFLALVGSNVYIYYNTEKKIEKYAKSPPFQMDDFTKSNRINKASKISNLRDQDLSTFWIKEKNSFRVDYDLEMELTLTHTYSDSKFKKKEFHTLTFYSCTGKNNINPYRIPNQLQVDVFLREAINIDKELRLPKDVKISSFTIDFKNLTKYQVDLSKIFTLQDSTTYPQNIFIVTLFIKDKSTYDSAGKSCLAEIEIE